MNFAVDDVHRSLRRFVALVLTEPWTVRTERQPVTPDERQIAVIEPSSPLTTGAARVTIPQGNVSKVMSFAAMAYPSVEATGAESRQVAQAVADLLDRAFSSGLVDADTGESVGAPFRIPVYDFDGVPVKGRNRRGASTPYGYAELDDLSVRVIQDPLDPLRFTVAVGLRLSWEQGGRLAGSAPIARTMPPTFEATV